MTTISLAIIVKNVEKTLDRCLSSFKPAVDEIVVVDTGSNDRSVEIAKKYTDKIFHFDWIDDFSAARNYSFDQCTSEFILWVDGDDYALPEDLEKLKAIDFTGKDTVICNYVYSSDEAGVPSSIVPRERLVRRSLGVKWNERIHEYLPLTGNIHVTDILIPRHNKQHGTSERNLKILEQVVKKDPENPRNNFYFGIELMDAGRQDEGAVYLEKFAGMPGAYWEDVYRAHYRVAEFYFSTDEGKFKYHVFKSLEIEERRAEPFYLMGRYWETKQQWDRAIQWYEQCTKVRRPTSLLAAYQKDYYTWMPCLQLCVCYNAIGDVQKAFEWNEKALEYRPGDGRMINNKNILQNGLKARDPRIKTDGRFKRLNLGCGGKKESGYTNVDLFSGPTVDEVFPFDDIPYLDGTIGGIHSEHSLEHVGFARVERTLREWWRVLSPGGNIILKMPDLSDCCLKYLDPKVPTVNGFPARKWYKYTIYGIQKSQAGEPDEAQYHTSGYSLEEMSEILVGIGFEVRKTFRYDGWGTPSFSIEAIKPDSAVKVGWVAVNNWDAAQTRIRVLKVNEWIKSKGCKSELVGYQEVINGDYSVCVIGKSFSEADYRATMELKKNGKVVICDLCEQIVDFPWVKEILSISDLVVCCSRELARIVQEKANKNTIVIEDAYENN